MICQDLAQYLNGQNDEHHKYIISFEKIFQLSIKRAGWAEFFIYNMKSAGRGTLKLVVKYKG